MTPCEFNQEDFCILQDEYPDAKCEKNKKGYCTAKEEDLTEFCECGEPVDNCDCGICWVLAQTKDEKIVPVTPREYAKLSKVEG